eukprot:TRINITY_DN39604_c0_g1_i1.p1 TRINITY_DN39604_c0_g1~~TRINITY_DN39604_c0_g1_i1.p1  ORF type:complete len:666 (+),score=171.72 TRINITY_DN39604_c0_g1_i1:247-1998(+)
MAFTTPHLWEGDGGEYYMHAVESGSQVCCLCWCNMLPQPEKRELAARRALLNELVVGFATSRGLITSRSRLVDFGADRVIFHVEHEARARGTAERPSLLRPDPRHGVPGAAGMAPLRVLGVECCELHRSGTTSGNGRDFRSGLACRDFYDLRVVGPVWRPLLLWVFQRSSLLRSRYVADVAKHCGSFLPAAERFRLSIFPVVNPMAGKPQMSRVAVTPLRGDSEGLVCSPGASRCYCENASLAMQRYTHWGAEDCDSETREFVEIEKHCRSGGDVSLWLHRSGSARPDGVRKGSAAHRSRSTSSVGRSPSHKSPRRSMPSPRRPSPDTRAERRGTAAIRSRSTSSVGVAQPQRSPLRAVASPQRSPRRRVDASRSPNGRSAAPAPKRGDAVRRRRDSCVSVLSASQRTRSPAAAPCAAPPSPGRSPGELRKSPAARPGKVAERRGPRAGQLPAARRWSTDVVVRDSRQRRAHQAALSQSAGSFSDISPRRVAGPQGCARSPRPSPRRSHTGDGGRGLMRSASSVTPVHMSSPRPQRSPRSPTAAPPVPADSRRRRSCSPRPLAHPTSPLRAAPPSRTTRGWRL